MALPTERWTCVGVRRRLTVVSPKWHRVPGSGVIVDTDTLLILLLVMVTPTAADWLIIKLFKLFSL